MKAKINSANLNARKKINLKAVNILAARVLKETKKTGFKLNIVFVSSQRIRYLNKRYLSKDEATDVLAFPTGDLEGDIAISSDRALSNAKFYGVNFREELARYVIHGILHLAGYDDTNGSVGKIMREKENELLKKTKKKYGNF